MKQGLIVIALLVAAPFALAQQDIYSWVDEKGVKHFSDKPPQGEDRQQVKGEIETGNLKQHRLNIMQPYTPPTAGKTMSSEKTGLKSSGGSAALGTGTSSKSVSGDSSKRSSNNSSSGLQSISGKVADYDKQERIKEIEDNRGKSSEPKTLTQKLKDYNDSKPANQ